MSCDDVCKGLGEMTDTRTRQVIHKAVFVRQEEMAFIWRLSSY